MDKQTDEKKLSRKEVIKQLKEIIDLFSKPLIKAKKSAKEDSLQAILNYLRVGVKYLLMSEEAYAREIGYLKKLLEDKEKNG